MHQLWFGCYLLFAGGSFFSDNASLYTARQVKYVCSGSLPGQESMTYTYANTGQLCVIPGVGLTANYQQVNRGKKGTLTCLL